MKKDIQAIYPLSPMQEGMLFHSLYAPESGAYCTQFVCTLVGRLDLAAFERAWQKVVERHSVLRTAFVWEGLARPMQVVGRRARLAVDLQDWRDLPQTRQQEQLQTWLEEDRRQGFTLSKAPLMRLTILRLGEQTYEVIWSHHHLLLDGWSLPLVLKEVFGFYEKYAAGEETELPPSKPYREYIAWLQRQDIKAAESYWREKLKGFSGSTAPAIERPEANGKAEMLFAEHRLELSTEVTAALRSTFKKQGVTLNTVIQGAWALLLSIYSGEPEVSFGAVVSGRPTDIAGVEEIVGLFINTLPVRVKVEPNRSVVEWLAALQQEQAEMRQYEYSPLLQVQSWSDAGHRVRLFESIFVFENYPIDSALKGRNGHLGLKAFQIVDNTNYPLAVAAGLGEKLWLRLTYDCSRYHHGSVKRMATHFGNLLGWLAANPQAKLGSVSVLAEDERARILVSGNDTQKFYADSKPIHRLFEDQVERAPEAVALVSQQEHVTYAALNRKANQLARHLQRLGVTQEALVGIYAERGINAVVGMLGILKAGAAYVTLDRSYPKDRLRYIIEDSRLAFVVTHGDKEAALPSGVGSVVHLDTDRQMLEQLGDDNLELEVDAHHLAYVIYTSGSTGAPKGVAGEHQAIVNRFNWMWERYPFAADERTCQKTSLGFVDSIWEVFGGLLKGTPTVIIKPESVKNVEEFIDELNREAVTRITAVPAQLKALVECVAETGKTLRTIRTCVSSGEELDSHLAGRIKAAIGQGRLLNLYGCTEIAADACWSEVAGEAETRRVPIGKAIANNRVYVLDRGLAPVPFGVSGELCVSGTNLARGYLGRPDLTAERFLPDPFGANAGSRMYRTGDLCRHRTDGELEYLGRNDRQVKIRGQRIELGEIEAQLATDATVATAAVVVSEVGNADKQLVAYLVGKDSAPQAGEQLRDYLREKLPDYMVPSRFIWLAQMPLTSSGKIDRKQLAAMEVEPTAQEAGTETARDQVEEVLAGIWEEVLGVNGVGIRQNFFELGGHSLLATQVVARVRRAFRVEIALREVFEHPTVAGLCARIKEQMRGATAQRPALERVERNGALPLSFAQQRLWFLDQLEPGSPVYNLPVVTRLTGPLNVAALEASVNEVVRRHEILRTAFPTEEGRPVQVIAAHAPFTLNVIDLATSASRDAEVAERIVEEARCPFDLSKGPLIRVSLLRLGEDEHLVLMTIHHIVSDAWSMELLIKEVSTGYELFAAGQTPVFAELPIQYADYALWQQDWIASGDFQEHLDFWKRELSGAPFVLELPTDHARPPRLSFKGARASLVIPESLTGEIKRLARQQGATLFMTMLAGFHALLNRYSGQTEMLIGTPVANRTRVETEALIGLFINMLSLRLSLEGEPTFARLLGDVRERVLRTYEYQEMPFEKLVEELEPERSLSHTPLFQAIFQIENRMRNAVGIKGLGLEVMHADSGSSRFDLGLMVAEADREIIALMEYRTELFDSPSIQRMLGHYQQLLEGMVSNPERAVTSLDLLTPAEARQALLEWNDTRKAYRRDATLPVLFHNQVCLTPEAVAIVDEDQQITYAQLSRRADRIARQLTARGVGPDMPVGICMERSADMVAGLLGIMKAGGGYLPLDPQFPYARLSFMVEDAGAKVVVTERSLLETVAKIAEIPLCFEDLIDEFEERHEPLANLVKGTVAGSSSSLIDRSTGEGHAYVIYTSGSTGKPKGVMVPHRQVMNFFAAMDEQFAEPTTGTWLALTSISFDISVLELFWTLTRGFKVVLGSGPFKFQGSLTKPVPAMQPRSIEFSLFYFGNDEASVAPAERYRLLIEGAKFADSRGFTAVWTPERHFHQFGGLYPNPAITSATLAGVTQRIQIRAGSVVLPLHHPIRVAEEWAMVDNLSNGRIGVSFASGWHADDFIFAPEHFADRKKVMLEQIEQVRKLWRGETLAFKSGLGRETEVRIFPPPIQPEIPVWLTAAGSAETFELAGRLGFRLLTHLLGQSLEDLSGKLALYRAAWREAGHQPGDGHVTLMLHTFIGEHLEEVRQKVRQPLINYLASSLDLFGNLAKGRPQATSHLADDDKQALLEHAFDRYFDTSALLGTPQKCLEMVARLKEVGVDEIACLIDFGVGYDAAMASLQYLDEVRKQSNRAARPEIPDRSLAEQLAWHEVTHMQCTPSLAKVLGLEEEPLDGLVALRKLLLGGEALPASLVRRLGEALPDCVQIHNMYGPTETTVWSTTHPVSRNATSVPIGKPLANTQVYILNEQLKLQPVGLAGELFIGGEGVVRGYLNRAALTAGRFVPDPFADQPDARMYRTGDLARWLDDGVLEFLSRNDGQVKIRGYRIELGEIEALLSAREDVETAIVVMSGEPSADPQLVAYMIGTAPDPLPGQRLREYLREKLPDYMVPSRFIWLAQMPLTANGKIDRKQLAAMEVEPEAREAGTETARDQVEEVLAGIWEEVLGVSGVGIRGNFFELGGHSLLATQVMARMRRAFGLEMALREIFEHPTVAGLGARIKEELRGEGGTGRPQIERVKREEGLPVSFAQQRLWFLDQLEPGSPFYNSSVALKIIGDLNITVVKRAINEIVRRHEVLRTSFRTVDGQPVQIITPQLRLELPVIDLEELSPGVCMREAQRLTNDEARSVIDITQPPLLRVRLLRMHESEHVASLLIHHIASDGWSVGILVRELAALYESYAAGKPSTLPELPVQYADYAVWQREWLEGPALQKQLSYWKRHLAGAPPLIQLPTDRPRPAVQTFGGATQSVNLSESPAWMSKALRQQEGVTSFMLLLTALKALLHHYTQETDLLVGAPFANRSLPEVEGLIGFFVNTLVLRTRFASNATAREVLREVKEVVLDASANEDVPFERLVEEMQPERSLSYTPLFQVMFGMDNTSRRPLQIGGLTFSMPQTESGTAQFDLSLGIIEDEQGLIGMLEYNTGLFDPTTIARMAEHYRALLEDICAHPDKKLSALELLPATERRQLLDEFNGAQLDYEKEALFGELFWRQAERTPDAVAVDFAGQQFTYLEMERRSNQLGRYLRRLGVGAESKVGICMTRSPEFYLAILGVLKAGAAYLPIDLRYPKQRQTFMLEDARVQVVLRRRGDGLEGDERALYLDEQWRDIAQESGSKIPNAGFGQNAAYVIYTSGSTGLAKGVEVSHASLINYAQIVAEDFNLNGSDRVWQLASVGFDVLVEEIFPVWLRGGAVVALPDSEVVGGKELVREIERHAITAVELPTVLWEGLMQEVKDRTGIGSLRLVIVGCEVVSRDLYEEWKKQGIELMHVYGLTETTVTTTIYKETAGEKDGGRVLPIGRVVGNTEVYILRPGLELVPIGVVGEIYIGGEGLARGYLNRPALTAERYVANPYGQAPGTRFYQTGDLGRFLADGNIEFLGRRDDQVKLRGYRIELGEIDAVLKQHPGISEAVSVIREEAPNHRQIVAYCVAMNGAPPNTSEIRNFLRDYLPFYMIPSAFVWLNALQLTANGKVDKSALPAPVADQVELSRDYLPPHNQLERDIAAIWQECLRVNRVGRHQNFFDIGGNSLITIQVQSKLAQRLGKEVPVIDLFRFPTISALAEHLAEIDKRLTFQENQARAEMRIAATTNLLQMRQQLRGGGGRGAARPRSGN